MNYFFVKLLIQLLIIRSHHVILHLKSFIHGGKETLILTITEKYILIYSKIEARLEYVA